MSDIGRHRRSRSRSWERDQRSSRSPEARDRGRGRYGDRYNRGLSNPPTEHPDANQGNTIYVSSIQHTLDESGLKTAFTAFGEIVSAKIVTDPVTRESRGFGFVTFQDSEMAKSAVEGMNGKPIDGREVKVEFSRRSKPHNSTPGVYFGPLALD
jgi:transformer-2 protein